MSEGEIASCLFRMKRTQRRFIFAFIVLCPAQTLKCCPDGFAYHFSITVLRVLWQ